MKDVPKGIDEKSPEKSSRYQASMNNKGKIAALETAKPGKQLLPG